MLDRTHTGGPPDGPDRPDPANTALRDALRRARIEAAQQTDVVIDLRATEIARLEILRDELEPVFAQVPREIDLFDAGLVPGDRPRLFVDMVAFVEMGRDRRSYRFMRDGRHGRTVVAESEQTGPIVDAVTSYVARRLIERERLLTDEDRMSLQPETTRRLEPAVAVAEPSVPGSAPDNTTSAERAPAAPPSAARPRSRWLRALGVLAAFVIGGGLGAALVLALIYAAAKGYIPL